MARTGAEPIGSMGTDTPVAVLSDAAPAAVRLLPAAVRPGHQPAARRHPRGAGHRRWRRRSAPRATCSTRRRRRCRQIVAADADPHQRRAGQAPLHQRRRRPPRLQALRRRRPVPGGRGRRRPAPGARRDPAPRCPTPSPSGAKVIVLSDRHSNAELAPIPSLLLTVGGAPPPHPGEDPHPGRPRRRDRRGPRGAPHGAAARLRRRRHQPVPRLRHDRGHDQTGPAAGRRRAQGHPQLHQGVRQGRAQGHVEDGHLDGGVATPAPRSSRPSASAEDLVDEYFTGTTSQLGGIGLDVLAAEAARPPPLRPPRPAPRRPPTATSWAGGEYQWRREGESTSSTPRRCSSSSTPPAPSATTSSRSTRRSSTTRPRRLATLRGPVRAQATATATAGPDRRGRAGQRDRQAVLHRRHVATARSRPRPTRRWPSP